MWTPVFYTKDSFGKLRHEMPQINYEDIIQYLIHFASNAKVEKLSMAIGLLKPAQREIDAGKVYDKVSRNDQQWKTRLYICSKEKYIIDGHHDYACGLEKDPSQIVTVYRVALPIQELLRRSNLLKFTVKKDITDQLVEAAIKQLL